MSETKLKQVQEQNQAAKAQQVETQQVEQVQTAVSTYPAVQRALADPDGITPNDAKILQRTFGNQAVRRFVLQRKMTVGPVGDKYEQEADAVAKQVVQTINAPIAPPVQRQEEEDELQLKPFPSAISLPIISTLQREWKPARPNLPLFPFLQRQEEDQELQAKGDSMLTGGDLSGDLESSVQQAKSGGQPLGDGVRGSMEQAFNADFSGVKVHTDTQSDTLNRSISARAFTTGSDIFFRSGEYNPDGSAGKTLLAHELTHTIQQGAAPALRRQVDDSGVEGGRETAVVQRQEEDEDIQMKPLSSLQRQEEDEDIQMKPQPVQRDSAAGFNTEDAFETNLNRQRGGGSPLPSSLRANFEPKFGANFSGVRVHTNSESHQLNQSIQAKAFTTGQDVFFRQGAYEPGSSSGQELIAHELTHVVQQGGASGEITTRKMTVQRKKLTPMSRQGRRLAIGRLLLPDTPKQSINKKIATYNTLVYDYQGNDGTTPLYKVDDPPPTHQEIKDIASALTKLEVATKAYQEKKQQEQDENKRPEDSDTNSPILAAQTLLGEIAEEKNAFEPHLRASQEIEANEANEQEEQDEEGSQETSSITQSLLGTPPSQSVTTFEAESKETHEHIDQTERGEDETTRTIRQTDTLSGTAKASHRTDRSEMKAQGEVTAQAEIEATAKLTKTAEELAVNLKLKAELMSKVKAHATGEYTVNDLVKINGEIDASLEAYVNAHSEFNAKLGKDGINLAAQIEASALAKAGMTGKVTLTVGSLAIQASGRASAEAGAMASIGGHFNVTGKNIAVGFKLEAKVAASASLEGTAKISDTIAVTGGISVSAGVGFKAAGDFSITNGVLKFDAELMAALGLGGGIHLGGEINIGKIEEKLKALILKTGIQTVYNRLKAKFFPELEEEQKELLQDMG